MEPKKQSFRLVYLLISLSIISNSVPDTDARTSRGLKNMKASTHLSYNYYSPDSLPPYEDVMGPSSSPENNPPYCGYPPFTPMPPSPTFATPLPPSQPIYGSPPGIVPNPPEYPPIPPITVPSPPEYVPSPPEYPPIIVPNPPENVPNPPIIFPNPPGF
ncbi:hypothetical protein J5N97_027362 [Dioscorea zingiberensis]|uniref:Uncharacterized protein n=1 Tax=Dioscorea zingiberensis TaxID=325984 RepID=A0A9D5C552_9LILI|nr:hypothetical protein J5N97_027362 [Dioscorea zingiberensis]